MEKVAHGEAQKTLPRIVEQVEHPRLWPTATARDFKGAYAPGAIIRRDGKSRLNDALPNAVLNWPTPTAGDGKQRCSTSEAATRRLESGKQVSLEVATIASWPTPTAADGGKIGSQPNYGQRCLSNHPAIVGEPTRPKGEKSRKIWPTPTTQDNPQTVGDAPKRGTTLGGAAREEPMPADPIIEMTADGILIADSWPPKGGKLNPDWVTSLMGFPRGWLDLAPEDLGRHLPARPTRGKNRA